VVEKQKQMIDDPHQGLGTPRKFGDNRCSHCDAEIGCGHPGIVRYGLVIRADSGRKVWIYCEPCDAELRAKLAVLRWP
jgi:hypothetical protein